MSKDWEPIVHCLRAELADYGGLLNLFEQQQRCGGANNSESVLNFATRIESQARHAAQSRSRREQAVAEFAHAKGRPTNSSFRTLLSLIEPDARPLLKALITEVNTLLHRVRRTGQQTHTLLSRAAQVHEETLQHLRPQRGPDGGSSSAPVAAGCR
jgi:hypothetical protein